MPFYITFLFCSFFPSYTRTRPVFGRFLSLLSARTRPWAYWRLWPNARAGHAMTKYGRVFGVLSGSQFDLRSAYIDFGAGPSRVGSNLGTRNKISRFFCLNCCVESWFLWHRFGDGEILALGRTNTNINISSMPSGMVGIRMEGSRCISVSKDSSAYDFRSGLAAAMLQAFLQRNELCSVGINQIKMQ